MMANTTAGQLDLASVIEVWGIERVEDVLPQIEDGVRYVAVHDGTGQSRVLPVRRVRECDPQLILDMLPGGQLAMYVDAATPAGGLPDHRPLLVRRGALLIGLLESDDKTVPAPQEETFTLPGVGEGADARVAAMSAIDAARESFRRRGISMVLDIQESRVEGDGTLVRDLVDQLLEEALGIIERSGGGTGVHVTVGQGQAGLWIGVEDSGTIRAVVDTDEIFSEMPTDDLSVLALRRIRARVVEVGGDMRVYSTRSGTRFMVRLPTP